jgi:glutaconate CoA-transferase, subunit B
MMNYSIQELMACRLSRELIDGEDIGVGANFPIARAAVLLAYYLHGPNIKIRMGAFRVNLENVSQVMSLDFFSDYRPVQWAESALYFPLDMLGFHKMDCFFISGIQIDAHGNTNLIGITDKSKRFKFRGPGSIGTTTLSAVAGRYYLVTEHHNTRTLVEKCSVISAMGFGDGKPGLRNELGLPGAGPKFCITPLGVFDFSPQTHRMRLHSLHPGVSLDQVVENTGFQMEIPDIIKETEPPTVLELETLRERVDPEGMLTR